MAMFLFGAYCCGGGFMFAMTLLLHVLGGDSRHLWKPFAVGIFWPIVLLCWLYDELRGSNG